MILLKRNKKILLAGWLLLSIIQLNAQRNLYDIDWDKINLAGAEAKILGSSNTGKDQNHQLIIQTFDTKEGKISVYLPPLSSTVMLSGTVYMEPAGKDSSKNLAVLQAYRLSLGNQVIPVQRGSFQITIPNHPSSGNISLNLSTTNGQVINTNQFPVAKATTAGNGFTIPPYVVSGDQAIITGNFDGDMRNASVMINGEKTELLAESPSRLFFTTHTNQTGNGTIELKENGTIQTSKINVLSLYLIAGKTNLRSGQRTIIHIKISGLAGLKEKVPFTINNKSSSVIALEGGDTQEITIDPEKDATAGVYELTRNIQSLKNGNFSVSVSIIPFSAIIR